MTATFMVTNEDETDTYNLITDNLKLISGSFEDRITENEEPVDISFKTIATGATEDAARTEITDFERLLHKINIYKKDPTTAETIFLKVQADGSEKARRTLLFKWGRKDMQTSVSSILQDKTIEIISQWVFTRHPYYEALPTDHKTKSLTGFLPNASVHKYDLNDTDNDYGTAPARIKRINFGNARVDTIFFGIKPTADSGANFSAVSECDSANGVRDLVKKDTNVLDNQTVAGASNGTCVVIPDTVSSYAARIQNAIPWATTNPSSFRGRYLVLLRAKLSAASSDIRMAMYNTWASTSASFVPAQDTYNDVYISDTFWDIYEMGIIQIPPEPYRAAREDAGVTIEALEVGLAAEWITGTADLQVDKWLFIPYDHFLNIKGINFNEFPPTGDVSNISATVDEEDNLISHRLTYENASPYYPPRIMTCETGFNDWVLPTGYGQNNTYILAATSDEGHDDSDLAPIPATLTIVPRYYSYNTD
jgi:hypothetical protein